MGLLCGGVVEAAILMMVSVDGLVARAHPVVYLGFSPQHWLRCKGSEGVGSRSKYGGF